MKVKIENETRVFPLQSETQKIIEIGFDIHSQLGCGFLEIVYKDAFEHEFRRNSIFYEREREYWIEYKNSFLSHRFYADFVVFEKVILEIKAKEGLAEEDFAQVLNYLKCSSCKVGLLLNFGRTSLQIKRLIL